MCLVYEFIIADRAIKVIKNYSAKFAPSSARLGNPADADVDFGDLIPGRIIYDSRLGKIKNTLEGTDSFRGARTVDAVGGDTGNSRIILGNAV